MIPISCLFPLRFRRGLPPLEAMARSAQYIKFDRYRDQEPVYADNGGKRAPLTVQGGAVIGKQLPESIDDLGLTPRSQGAVALYIAPHVVKEKPRAASSLPIMRRGEI